MAITKSIMSSELYFSIFFYQISLKENSSRQSEKDLSKYNAWQQLKIFQQQRNLNSTEEEVIKDTGKFLSEALLFAEHGENMLCTKIGLNLRNNFCKQHVLPRFELGIFMY